jgi:predicted transcriptional regulator
MARITVRVSEEEAKLIRQYAERTGTTVSLFIRRAVMDRIGNEHARPLLSQYLETAGRGDFIPCEEARKEWELE